VCFLPDYVRANKCLPVAFMAVLGSRCQAMMLCLAFISLIPCVILPSLIVFISLDAQPPARYKCLGLTLYIARVVAMVLRVENKRQPLLECVSWLLRGLNINMLSNYCRSYLSMIAFSF
jgi:hypothetical protein